METTTTPQIENQEQISPKPIEETPVEDRITSIRKQVEFYLSQENLPNDKYLHDQLDPNDGYVSIETIFQFPKVATLHGNDRQLLLEAIRTSSELQMDPTNTRVKPKYLDENKTRCTIILRQIPPTTPEAEIRSIFSGSNLEIVEAKPEIMGDLWYIKFNCNEDAKHAFEFIMQKNSENEKQIRARIKDGHLFDFLTPKVPPMPVGQVAENAAPAFIPNKDFGKTPQSGSNFLPPHGQQFAYNKFDARTKNRKPRYENNSYPQTQNQDFQNADDQSKPFKRNFNNNYNNKYSNYNTDDRRKNNMKRLPKKPKKPVPDFDQSAFPPLPAVEKTGGYEGNFLHYTKSQIIGVFQKTVGEVAEQEIQKPLGWEKFVGVVAAAQAPNKTLEMTKPLPNMSSHSIIQIPPEKSVKAEGDKNVEEVEQPSILVEDEPALFTSFAEAAITTKDIALNDKGSKHKLEIQVQNKKKNEKKDNSQKPVENAQPSKEGDAKSQKAGKQFNKGSRNFDNKKGFPKREKSYREKQTDSKTQPQEQHSAQEEAKPQEQTQQPQEPQVESISYASVAEKKEKSE